MTPLDVLLYDDATIYGGAERYLELLALNFDRDRVAASVVLSPDAALDPLAARLAAGGVSVTRLPPIPTLSAARSFARAFGFFLRRRPSIVHFNLVDPRACNSAIVAARFTGHRAIVTTEHLPHSPFDDLPTPRRHQVAMATTRRHIVVSEAGAAALAARGVARDAIVVIHNGVAEAPPLDATKRAAARTTIAPGATGPIVGFSGRLSAQKNPALFVEAAAHVAAADPGVRFAIIGDGPDRDDLDRRVNALGLRDCIRFLGHRADACDLYAGCDMLVFTSRYEGLPFTVLEAMALGIPVIAPRIPGMDEAVVDGETGVLLDVPADAAAYSAAILAMLADPARRSSVGAAARARASSQFSLRAMVERTAAVYESVR